MPKLNSLINTISPVNKPKEKTGESYLKVTLSDNQEIAIEMKYVRQVLVIPSEKITFLPNLPTYMIGLFNQRNKIFWLIQLSLLLKLNLRQRNIKNYEIVIIKNDDISLGLAVEKVNNMIRLQQEQILNISELANIETKSYLKGYFLEDNQSKTFILNPKKITFYNYKRY